MNEIPIWERYILSIPQASEYFHIGENKIRQLISNNGDADFVIHVGNRTQIKRKQFEKFIDQRDYI